MDQVNTDFNMTYITLGGHVKLHQYRYLYFVVMFAAFILILYGNFTVVLLIMIRKSLHEPMYIFIAALLVNSVLFSTVIYPKLLIDFLSDRQIIPYSQCAFQSFMYYSVGGSESLLLAVMAYDRYVSICKPLQYPLIMKKTTVVTLLVLAWLLPACQLAPSIGMIIDLKVCRFTLKGIFCNNSLSKLYCERPREAYIIYGVFLLLNTTLAPFLFIIITYIKILLVLHRSCREVRNKAAQTCLPHLLVLISFSCLCSHDIIIARLDINMPKTAHFIITLQAILYHPLFNPIIYGLKMTEISTQLKRLFCKNKFTDLIRL